MYFKRKNDVHTSSHLWSNDFDEKSFLYFIQPTLLELGNEVWKFAIAIFLWVCVNLLIMLDLK